MYFMWTNAGRPQAYSSDGRGAPPGARVGSCRAAVRPPVNLRSQNDREVAIYTHLEFLELEAEAQL